MGLPCKLAPGFPPASPHVPFFPLLISLCTFFAIIKLSRENDHVLGAVSPSAHLGGLLVPLGSQGRRPDEVTFS